jgi:hypothetical protein
MNLMSFRLAVLLPILGGLVVHAGSVFSGQEGNMNHSMILISF